MLNGLTPSVGRLEVARPLLKNATVAIANLEVPLTDGHRRTDRKSAGEIKARSQFVLKADPRHAPVLAQWGFNVLTEGNNHEMDYRWEGLSQCLRLLDQNSILHSGAGSNSDEAWIPARCPVGDLTVSIGAALAFAGTRGASKCTPATADQPGVATFYLAGSSGKKKIQALVGRLRQGEGPVVLCLHWGSEQATVPRPYQVALGRACIDAGADAVIGAHPHVLQGGEVYRGKPILYSLGNLVSSMPCEVALAELKFEGRTFLGLNLHPFQCRGGVLRRYKVARRRNELQRFSALCAQIQTQFPSDLSEPIDAVGFGSERD